MDPRPGSRDFYEKSSKLHQILKEAVMIRTEENSLAFAFEA